MAKHTKEEIKKAVEKCLTNGIFSECKGCAFKGENPCIPALVKDLFDLIDKLENENRLLKYASDGLIETVEKYIKENEMLRNKLEYMHSALAVSCERAYATYDILEKAMDKTLNIMDGEE